MHMNSFKNHCSLFYALTAKITSKSISKAVAAAYDAGVKQKATIPEKVLSQYNLLPEDEAGYLMHFPKDEVQLTHARKTIAFGEFYHFLAWRKSDEKAAFAGEKPFRTDTA